MWQAHHIRHVEQRRVGQWLPGKHIQPRSADLSSLQGCYQGLLIHHRATGSIDQDGFGFHHRQFGGSNEVVGFRCQRHDRADKIRRAQQLLPRYKTCPQFLLQLGFRAIAAVQDIHAEAESSAPGNGGANLAQTDDAQRLAMHITAEMGFTDRCSPIACLYPGIQLRYPSSGGQHQCQSQVGGGLGQHVRGVGQHDAPAAEVIHIVIVIAHGDGGENFQLRRIGQLGGTQPSVADQAVGQRQCLLKLCAHITQLGLEQQDIEFILKGCE